MFLRYYFKSEAENRKGDKNRKGDRLLIQKVTCPLFVLKYVTNPLNGKATHLDERYPASR